MEENSIANLQEFRDALNENGIELSDSASEQLYDDYNIIASSNIDGKEDVMRFLTTELVQETAVSNEYNDTRNEINQTEADNPHILFDDSDNSGLVADIAYAGTLEGLMYNLDDIHDTIVNMIADGSGTATTNNGEGKLTLTANDDGTFTVKTDYDTVPEYNTETTYENLSDAIDAVKHEIDTSDAEEIVESHFGEIEDSVNDFVNDLPYIADSQDTDGVTSEDGGQELSMDDTIALEHNIVEVLLSIIDSLTEDIDRPNDIKFENVATMDNGEVTHLTIEPSADGDGYDVAVHPVTADGNVHYDINIESYHADNYNEAKAVFNDLREEWNTGTDHADEYEHAMEEAGFSKDDIFVNDTFDPMSRHDADDESDSADKNKSQGNAIEDNQNSDSEPVDDETDEADIGDQDYIEDDEDDWDSGDSVD